MSLRVQRHLADEDATVEAARELAPELGQGGLLFLRGELGAGKTTFCRGVLRGLGHEGAVKSPTFTLVEPYRIQDLDLFHFDLYRLSDPNELEYVGVDDYMDADNLCLVEWPERGEDFLPACDLVVELRVEGAGRMLTIEARSKRGEQIIRRMTDKR